MRAYMCLHTCMCARAQTEVALLMSFNPLGNAALCSTAAALWGGGASGAPANLRRCLTAQTAHCQAPLSEEGPDSEPTPEVSNGDRDASKNTPQTVSHSLYSYSHEAGSPVSGWLTLDPIGFKV